MKTPEQCSGLEDVRLGIDTLDEQIIRALGQRLAYVKAAAQFKPDEASIAAPERVAAM
ncbi:chorismate mutase, partial [Pseudomonas sp. K5002]